MLRSLVRTARRFSTRDVSFAQGLFMGKVNSAQVLPFPKSLDAHAEDTLKSLIPPIERFFAEKVDSSKIDSDEKIPEEVLEGLKQLGLFGLQIPEDYGGLGLSNTAYARVAEEVVSDPSIAVTLMAHQSIGLKVNPSSRATLTVQGILLFGNPEQKEKYLPKLATGPPSPASPPPDDSGENIAAFALTEPTSGSDAASIRTRATLSADGKHWLLNGGKIWISNGALAEVFTVFAKTEVTTESGEKKDKITAFIVERAFGGLTHGKNEKKLGIKGSATNEVYFENCPVPVENVLGEVGGGFKVAMNILNNGRFGLGAGAAGAMKELLRLTAQHANTRKQFGKLIREFGLVKEKFGKIAVRAYAMEAMAYLTTALIDGGRKDCQAEAAICKIYGSESLWLSVNDCLQVMGGAGYMRSYPFERQMRDSRILLIFEGTNEILRLFIALSGIQGPAEHLKALAPALKSPLKHKDDLIAELQRRAARLYAPPQFEGVHSRLSSSSAKFSRLVASFGAAVDGAVAKYQKNIMGEQLVLKRIADITIDLYGMAAVLSRATKTLSAEGEESAAAEHEALLAEAFCAEAAVRVNENVAGLNSPKKTTDGAIGKIADTVLDAGKYVAKHPLGF